MKDLLLVGGAGREWRTVNWPNAGVAASLGFGHDASAIPSLRALLLRADADGHWSSQVIVVGAVAGTDRLVVSLSPVCERIKGGAQRAAEFRQLITACGRHVLACDALDDAIGFQLAQLRGQYLVRYERHG